MTLFDEFNCNMGPRAEKAMSIKSIPRTRKKCYRILKGSSVLKKVKCCKQVHFRCTYVLRGTTVICPLPIQDVLMPSEAIVIQFKPIMIILCTKIVMIFTIDPELI